MPCRMRLPLFFVQPMWEASDKHQNSYFDPEIADLSLKFISDRITVSALLCSSELDK